MNKQDFNQLARIVYQNMPDFILYALAVAVCLSLVYAIFINEGLFLENDNDRTEKTRNCIEKDSVLTKDGVRLVLHFRDCDGGGTIAAACSDPIFGRKESARIMKADNVVGLDAVGYGNRLDNESDRRSCTIKYQFSREEVTDTVLAIFHEYK